MAERAAARGALPIGIDIADGMLVEARRRHPELEFVAGDAEALAFGDGSFDAVVGAFVLNHLPHPERAAAEAARVVVAGGAVAFADWDRPDRMQMLGVLGRAFDQAGIEGGASLPPGPDPERFTDAGELRRLLESAGLAEVRTDSVQLAHRVESAEALWQGFLGGTVRGAAMVRAQPAEAQARIREALDRVLDDFRDPEGFALSICAHIVSGRRPRG